MLLVHPAEVARHQPFQLERHVELICKLPLECLLASLAYNLLLICVCCYYAFRTRRLPDNFNESRYISLCVYTTLIIWLAFLPTFFTAARALYRILLLSCALLVNATALLMCLFTPKLYAICCNIVEGNNSTSTSTGTGGSNFVFHMSASRVRLSLPNSGAYVDGCLSEVADLQSSAGD